MDTLLVVARLSLAMIFAVAALAKLTDPRSARQGLVEFGVPGVVARPGAFVLPLVELAIAGALVVPATVWLGAVAASGLLAAFTAAVAVNLLRGRRPDCRCFGQIGAGPIGAPTMARNVLLMGVAALIVAQGPAREWPQLFEPLTALEPSAIGALLAAVILGMIVGGWLLIQILQQNGRLLLRIEALEKKLGVVPAVTANSEAASAGLPVGSTAPTFRLTGVHGETQTLDALRAQGKPILLLFTDPECGPCTALLPDLARWQRELVGTLTIAFISRRSRDANRVKATEHGLTNVLVQEKDEVSDAYRARGTPAAVLLSKDGVIASPVVAGVEAIRGLAARFSGQAQSVNAAVQPPMVDVGPRCPHCGQMHAATPAAASTLGVGDPAPGFTLPDLSGRSVSLSDFKGAETLVVFWNPGCGFCQQLTEEWKSWEAARPAAAPRPLIVSTGSTEANRGMDLRSPVIIEPQFSVGYAFGASGTPSAVLVDADGRIASRVAVGGPAVMALARSQTGPSVRRDER